MLHHPTGDDCLFRAGPQSRSTISLGVPRPRGTGRDRQTAAVTGSRRSIRITRFDAATVVFAIPASLMAIGLATVHGRTIALVVIGMVAVTVALRRQALVGAVMIAGASVPQDEPLAV